MMIVFIYWLSTLCVRLWAKYAHTRYFVWLSECNECCYEQYYMKTLMSGKVYSLLKFTQLASSGTGALGVARSDLIMPFQVMLSMVAWSSPQTCPLCMVFSWFSFSLNDTIFFSFNILFPHANKSECFQRVRCCGCENHFEHVWSLGPWTVYFLICEMGEWSCLL